MLESDKYYRERKRVGGWCGGSDSVILGRMVKGGGVVEEGHLSEDPKKANELLLHIIH